jgi:hypothetical protein
MLNSQHRRQQKKQCHPIRRSLLFFLLPPYQDSQRFPKRCAGTFFFYAVSFQSVNSRAYRQHGSFAILLFFLIDVMLSRLYKIKQWALKTVAAAAGL